MSLWGLHFSQNTIQKLPRFLPWKFQNVGQKFLVGILGEMMTSNINSEFYWPLAQKLNSLICKKTNSDFLTQWDPWRRVHLNKNSVWSGCVADWFSQIKQGEKEHTHFISASLARGWRRYILFLIVPNSCHWCSWDLQIFVDHQKDR